jgi:hypothetical protein
MSAPSGCAEDVRRRATVSAFLAVGFSCVYRPTVNSKPRLIVAATDHDALLNQRTTPYPPLNQVGSAYALLNQVGSG